MTQSLQLNLLAALVGAMFVSLRLFFCGTNPASPEESSESGFRGRQAPRGRGFERFAGKGDIVSHHRSPFFQEQVFPQQC
jgi:hypothetical protein